MKKIIIITIAIVFIVLKANAQDSSYSPQITSVHVVTNDSAKYVLVGVAIKPDVLNNLNKKNYSSCTVYANFADAEKYLEKTSQGGFIQKGGSAFRFECKTYESAKLLEDIKLFKEDFRVVAY